MEGLAAGAAVDAEGAAATLPVDSADGKGSVDSPAAAVIEDAAAARAGACAVAHSAGGATVDAEGAAAATLPVAGAVEAGGIEDCAAAGIEDTAAAGAGTSAVDDSAGGARVQGKGAAATRDVACANEEGGVEAGAVTASAGTRAAAVAALTPEVRANGARTGVARGGGNKAGLPRGRLRRCTPFMGGFVKDFCASDSFPVPLPDGDATALLDVADCPAFAFLPGVALEKRTGLSPLFRRVLGRVMPARPRFRGMH